MIAAKRIFAALIIGVVLVHAPFALAGEVFPDLVFSGDLSESQKVYLGLKSNTFKLSDVDADYVLVEGFSMYCPICQRDAPLMNDVYAAVTNADPEGRVKILGLGLGNSQFEIAFFQKKYAVPFPLVPDEEYTAHKALGEVGTPAVYLVKIAGGANDVLYFKEGEIADSAALIRIIQEKAGLK